LTGGPSALSNKFLGQLRLSTGSHRGSVANLDPRASPWRDQQAKPPVAYAASPPAKQSPVRTRAMISTHLSSSFYNTSYFANQARNSPEVPLALRRKAPALVTLCHKAQRQLFKAFDRSESLRSIAKQQRSINHLHRLPWPRRFYETGASISTPTAGALC